MVVVGLEVDEQLVHLVEYFFGSSISTVNFVDDNNGRKIERQCLLQHIARLRKRTFGGVDQEQNAVNHGEGSLYFPTKVGVTRSVHQVDLGVLVDHRGSFSQNGDASLTFLVIGVHDTIDHRLVSSERSSGTQKSVHKSCFSMVNVRD